MPTTSLVLESINALENTDKPKSYSGDLITPVELTFDEAIKITGHTSKLEIRYWLVRISIATSFLMLFLFLFFHDY